MTNNIIPYYNKKRKVFGVNMKKNISDRIQLGKTDIWVSPVGCGVLPMGPGQLALPVDEGAELICYALSKGINFIDTAQYYRTYPYIRRALEMLEGRSAKACRACARPVISSKTLASDYDGAYSAILEECKSLGVAYIDIFLLHEVRSGQFAMRQGAWRALMAAKAEGLVRAIGVSTHHVDVVEELTWVPACDVIFPLINYAGMGIRRGRSAASCADMAAAIAAARGAGKGIYSMKALGGGNLAAHYCEALDYVFGLDCIDSVMLGFGCRRDIDDVVSYLDGSMPDDYSPDVSAKRVRVNQEDCEGCGTCLAVCHSAAIAYNKNGLAEIDRSKCITCGYCAQACPVRAIIMF
ncbi:MAG: aldo/keto reductase [Firmicutes bacterium]|nr:aldo/keto reductase [Bacillota bacterium]